LGRFRFDTPYDLAEAFLDGGSRSLRCLTRSPLSSSQADRTSELARESLDLFTCLVRAPTLADPLCLLQILGQAEEAGAIALDGLVIEERSCIPRVVCRFPSSNELENVKFVPSTLHELSEERKAAAIAKPQGALAPLDRPRVALAADDQTRSSF